MKKIVVVLMLIAICMPAYGWEAKFKERAEMFISEDRVKESSSNVYVSLDIDEKKITYKEVKKGKPEGESLEYKVVSEGEAMMAEPKALLQFTPKKKLGTQNVIRAVHTGDSIVSILLVGETFLIECKTSDFFGNAVEYGYYERVR